ncbi:L-dopachrome tautomerase-related protein [Citrobacter portucalensis]|uniref:L-dopachrome tautomerase-related protein n=1 Tax=Citrobacter portucalensis TaxID=1639133 RepID=UPI002243A51D|nr:L-dopachrome tautomerase-related protein [Citrobacter portucalensis]MCW8353263.1 major royal jelly family protein [Citrobacter portucalensis]MCX8994355.1 major royal jelly family protein [Citrobacter portucalensis]MCX9017309.1 major royal jelly family protein [Citrobacter portucalensis]MCX9054210.1 major royal jelly family protein [Citrobacter portucalensis]MCX9059027.1 major royal jelly family protein [Citrobacter portucalensis]
MNKKTLIATLLSVLISNSTATFAETQFKKGDLEVVAALNIRPGNVTVSDDGRVFATVHPLDRPSRWRLIEITGKETWKAWPDDSWQKNEGQSLSHQIDTPLGITRDAQNRLWLVDMGLNSGKTRIISFDIKSGKHLMTIELDDTIAPRGSFIQDLVVDARGGWIYLADISNPGLITVNIASKKASRFSGHPALQSERSAVMHIDGQDTLFNGKPASVGVNPITLSANGKTLFFGAMNGTTWYEIDTEYLQKADDKAIAQHIRTAGTKPVSDGAAISAQGRHYFTNLNNNGVDMMDSKGKLIPLVRSALLDWPDSVQFGDQHWLYISANQLHRSAAFTGAGDKGEPPYRILRVWTDDTQPFTSSQ